MEVERADKGTFERDVCWPNGSAGKEFACSAGDPGGVASIPGLGRSPGEEMANCSMILVWKKSHGQRSLVGYSPVGFKESDMTEQLSWAHAGLCWALIFVYLLEMNNESLTSYCCKKYCPVKQYHAFPELSRVGSGFENPCSLSIPCRLGTRGAERGSHLPEDAQLAN